MRENVPAPYRCFPTNWSRAPSMPAPYRRFPINRISGETCRCPTEMNLCVSTNQTYGENMPAPYKRHFLGISVQLVRGLCTAVCAVLNEQNKSTTRSVLYKAKHQNVVLSSNGRKSILCIPGLTYDHGVPSHSSNPKGLRAV